MFPIYTPLLHTLETIPSPESTPLNPVRTKQITDRHVLDKAEAEGDVLIATEWVETFCVQLQVDEAHVTGIHRLHADALSVRV